MLNGKVALVTGASRGIGRAIAVQLAKEGADIAFCFHRAEDAARKTAELIAQTGRRCWYTQADLTQGTDASRLVDGTVEALGRLDILVNNTGTTQAKLFLETTDEDWDHLMDTNLKSAFMVSRRAAKVMRRNKWGRIIHIGSVGGERLLAGVAAHYAASKAGLSGLTLGMAKELARYNILVNCVAPGLIETDLSESFLTPEMKLAFKTYHPLRRAGTPQEVADLVAFLASDKSSYLTGETLVVGGGIA